MDKAVVDQDKLEALIAEARASGGAERSNYQLFIVGLCDALGLDRPAMAQEQNQFNDYVFERSVAFKHPDGSKTSGFIDCYRKGRFILEAKQSRKREKARAAQGQLSLLPEEAGQFKAGHALRGSRSWDQVMVEARKQAENYARALPVEHGYPPFLLVVDVGHVIEVFADFSGQGKNYAQFPDRQSYRLTMDALRDPAVQARLAAIWTDPLSLDPTRIAAAVTRDIADRLARIAKRLEGRHDAKAVAEFLMRCLFTMFAEDVRLIPEHGFRDLLGRMRETPGNFVPALESLWAAMDEGKYAPHLNATLKRFNGALFKTRTALPLDADDITELWIAAGKDWSEVEPAIFGTLLERALDPRERSKLGAHYTPRAYVERLVVPTIIEPLRADWELVQGQVKELEEKRKRKAALDAVLSFHRKLCTTRVLDPACGTGNFLYVALELMKKLEGEVLDAIAALGGQPDRYADHPAEAGRDLRGQRLARTGGRFTVDPHQFYGLEINPRAVPIADLVIWIGYLKWQLRTVVDVAALSEPILDAYGTIREQDAILSYEDRKIATDQSGRPITIWDGITHKKSSVSSSLIPDQSAQIETYIYTNPKRSNWPESDFVVGNPPFIGNKLLRRRLGDGYVDSLFRAYSHLSNGIDFVSYWWAIAAEQLLCGRIKGFGFVTTKSIAQISNRVVVDPIIDDKECHINFAIPNHPWIDQANAAAVRVAFTVVRRSREHGLLARVVSEKKIVRGEPPVVDLIFSLGSIHSDLNIGVDVTKTQLLLSNADVSFQGCKLGHDDFQIGAQLVSSVHGSGPMGQPVRRYIGGDQIKDQTAPAYVIDLFGLSEEHARDKYPAAYQHLYDHVKPFRNEVRRSSYREKWWLFEESRPDFRKSLGFVQRYIATVEVSRHRYFVFEPWPQVLVDGSVIGIVLDCAHQFAILHSRVHCFWALRLGGRMGAGNDPRYQNSIVFDKYPFPEISPIANELTLQNLHKLGERLNNFRNERLAEHAFLTMTGLYNALERLREVEHGYGEPLTQAERDVHRAGLISVLKEIHDDIDRAVFSAYGWDDLAPMLVGRPGATLPSPHKSPEQEGAEAELLARLVALNHERAAEEKRGLVRWLRPDYQIPRLGAKVPKARDEHVGTLDVALPEVAERPKWPADGLEQIRLVRDLLAQSPAPTASEAIASVFDGRSSPKRRERVTQVLETLVATGLARTGDQDGQRRYFLPR